ncbi:MAG: dihydrofolate reductase, partial [Muribaculaceae bacterium]|nr:dihydrofolate reductase [Muribaculaceae bacterium]
MKRIIPTLILGTMATLNSEAVVDKSFDYHVDRFADIEVLRYEVPEYNRLSLQQKKMLYYLSQAAQMGRDILWDQNGKYNLQIRQLLEKIYTGYKGNREDKDFKAFEKYLKQVWFGNGIHHHYSTDKFRPEFSKSFFEQQVANISDSDLPLAPGQTREEMI